MVRAALCVAFVMLAGCAVRRPVLPAVAKPIAAPSAPTCPAPGVFCVEVDPESTAVLKSLNMRDLIEYDVLACNRTTAPRSVPVEEIKMAITQQAYALGIPAPHFVDSGRATNLLTYHQSKSAASQISKWAYRVGVAAMVIAGSQWVKAGTEAFQAIAFATIGAKEVEDNATAAVPQLTPYLNTLLGASVSLNPGQCVTGSMFAGPAPRPQAIQAVIP